MRSTARNHKNNVSVDLASRFIPDSRGCGSHSLAHLGLSAALELFAKETDGGEEEAVAAVESSTVLDFSALLVMVDVVRLVLLVPLALPVILPVKKIHVKRKVIK